MPEADLCDRCDLPFVGERYLLRVGGAWPGSGALDLTVCEGCLKSLRRWLDDTPNRKGDAGDAAGRVRPKRVRSRYAAELDHGVYALRRRMYANLVVFLATACALIGSVSALFYFFILSD